MKKMKTKMKRGKAIIGIAMAAIMLASVFAAVMPTGTAVSKGNNFNYIGNIPGEVQTVLVGQNIQFNNTAPNSFGPARPIVYRFVGGDLEDTWESDETTWRVYNVNWPTTGAYYVSSTPITNQSQASGKAQISIKDPKIPLKLKVEDKEVSSMAVGSKNFWIDVGGINLFPEDKVDLVVIGPNGQIKTDDTTSPAQKFTNITVKYLKDRYGGWNNISKGINTSKWDIGVYTFRIQTKEQYACGLEADGSTKELRILKGAIAIEADTTETVELNTVTLTVTGVASDKIQVWSSPCDNAKFKAGIDDTPPDPSDYIEKQCRFNDTIDSDGVMKYAIEFNDTGTYTIRAEVKEGPVQRVGDYDTVDITVSEKEVTFDLPSTVVIGDRIKIKGTSLSGTYVSVFVDDTLYNPLRNLVLDDGEFEKEVRTNDIGMTVPGSVRIKAWIDCDKAAGQDPPKTTADGEDAILLTTPDLTAELSASYVACGDSFYVEGTAAGSQTVQIMCVPPRGGGGKSLTVDGEKGITLTSASVSTTDNHFERKISVQDNANSGFYDIYVLSPGMDGKWDATGQTSLKAAISDRYNIDDITDPSDAGTLSQEGVFDILVDLTTTAGSDDLMWVEQIKVEEPSVMLDPIADVGIGEPLVVTGTSNRKSGYTIVVTVKGMFGELDPATVKVENGTFSATFNTSDTVEGEYLVKADDGDGHSDETVVTIGAAVPTIAPTEEPTEGPTERPTERPTEKPTEKPTAAPTPTEKPTPGFEALFAIAGLIAVAYLVIKRKK